MAKANALTVARLTTLPAGKQCDGDLPLNFHPAGTGARWVDTPVGAAGATDIRAKLVCGAARVSLAVERCAANALGVRWPSTECGHVSLKSARHVAQHGFVEKLIAHAPVETFDDAVLHGLARRGVMPFQLTRRGRG